MKEASIQFMSLRIKLLIGFTAMFSVVFSGAYYWFYTVMTAKVSDQIEITLRNTLEGVISEVDGDEFEAIAQLPFSPEQPVPDNNALYQEHQRWLYQIHVIQPNAIPYTFVPGTQPYEVLWVGDVFRIIKPEDATTFRESYDSSNSRLYEGLTRVTVTMTPYTDPWGNWVSAYGPIYNATGEVVGGMGVDLNAEYLYDLQQEIRDRFLPALLVTYGILFGGIYWLSGFLTKRLSHLSKAAQGIKSGDYDLSQLPYPKSNLLPDELSELSLIFRQMVETLIERENHLKQLNINLEAIVEDRTAALQVANQELDDHAQALTHSLEEKDLLLREVHHRVKNNLQVISSLLSLQGNYPLPGEMQDLLLESRNRIRSMALVHEQLYQSNNLAQIDFVNYIPALASQLFATYSVNTERVRLHLNVSKVVLGIDTAIPCGLLLNELLSNALKHAFPEQSRGKIEVGFHPTGDSKLLLLVRDTGVGLPPNFVPSQTSSLGMRLVQALTRQLSGELKAYNDCGAVFQIIFPPQPIRYGQVP